MCYLKLQKEIKLSFKLHEFIQNLWLSDLHFWHDNIRPQIGYACLPLRLTQYECYTKVIAWLGSSTTDGAKQGILKILHASPSKINSASAGIIFSRFAIPQFITNGEVWSESAFAQFCNDKICNLRLVVLKLDDPLDLKGLRLTALSNSWRELVRWSRDQV